MPGVKSWFILNYRPAFNGMKKSWNKALQISAALFWCLLSTLFTSMFPNTVTKPHWYYLIKNNYIYIKNGCHQRTCYYKPGLVSRGWGREGQVQKFYKPWKYGMQQRRELAPRRNTLPAIYKYFQLKAHFQ